MMMIIRIIWACELGRQICILPTRPLKGRDHKRLKVIKGVGRLSESIRVATEELSSSEAQTSI
jgi:hypothetical protein